MTIPGIDVSSHNHPGNAPINWGEVSAAGYRFAIVKVSEGSGDGYAYRNPYALEDLAGARAAGLDVAGYLYLHPSLPGGPQAAFYLASFPAGPPHGVGIDIEISEHQTAADIASCVNEAAVVLARAGLEPMLYTDQSMWVGLEPYWHGLLWLAAPGHDQPAASGLDCWQWDPAGTVAGITGAVDLDDWTDPGTYNTFFVDSTPHPPGPSPRGAPEMVVLQIGVGQGAGIFLLREAGNPIPLTPSEVPIFQRLLGQPAVPTVESSFAGRVAAAD